jgi:predicted acyl esterase
VQSSLFPLLDRNPQSWVDNIFEAEEDDFIAATHRVFRSADRPSHMEIGVLHPGGSAGQDPLRSALPRPRPEGD